MVRPRFAPTDAAWRTSGAGNTRPSATRSAPWRRVLPITARPVSIHAAARSQSAPASRSSRSTSTSAPMSWPWRSRSRRHPRVLRRHAGGSGHGRPARKPGQPPMAQVSTNLVDWQRTGIAGVVREVRRLAREAGTDIDHCELIGLAPTGALLEVAADSLGLADFSPDQALELRLARDRYRPVPAEHRLDGNPLALRASRRVSEHRGDRSHGRLTPRDDRPSGRAGFALPRRGLDRSSQSPSAIADAETALGFDGRPQSTRARP